MTTEWAAAGIMFPARSAIHERGHILSLVARSPQYPATYACAPYREIGASEAQGRQPGANRLITAAGVFFAELLLPARWLCRLLPGAAARLQSYESHLLWSTFEMGTFTEVSIAMLQKLVLLLKSKIMPGSLLLELRALTAIRHSSQILIPPR